MFPPETSSRSFVASGVLGDPVTRLFARAAAADTPSATRLFTHGLGQKHVTPRFAGPARFRGVEISEPSECLVGFGEMIWSQAADDLKYLLGLFGGLLGGFRRGSEGSDDALGVGGRGGCRLLGRSGLGSMIVNTWERTMSAARVRAGGIGV